ncbi:TetR/AcrR family transcriptional regulator [Actinomadura sp. ATCC 31491]|uniref:TetR/AcrR family transcriptional regulator n=1 Tax=Actinomadura luzonensis TaxID=2805427 RepID=A0ABT0FVH2_9ACTN|nr:ScbR family autoregulator-binding transcription factor [Actinomadura luzonensis]MCK2216183.1 TetR/AcrR family transcriptional regulator [Actinomadura luzonensis]UKU09934.1 Luz10 [Actinomadura luzonensis]
MARRLQQRAERTRAVVLRAAAEVFAADGFRGARMADIIARTAVTKGAVYFHFSSKEELAQAVVAAHREEGARLAETVAAQGATPLRTLINLSYAYARLIKDNPIHLAGVRLVAEGTFGSPTLEAFTDWDLVLVKLLEEAKDRGELRGDLDAEACARFINSAFYGTQILSFIYSRREDLMQRLDTMWQVLLNGLLPEGRSVILMSQAG